MPVAYDSAARFHAPAILKLRYLGYPGDYRRYTPAEQAEDAGNGSTCVMIRETNGHMNGYGHGLADGRDADALMAELGRDAGTEAVVLTIDHGGPYNYENIAAYMDGARDAGCRNRIFYGPNHIGDRLVDEGHAEGVWVAGAFSWSTGWDGNPTHRPPCRHAVGWQFPRYVTVGGVQCDYNEFLDDLAWIAGGRSTGLHLEWAWRIDEQPAWNQRGTTHEAWITQNFSGEGLHEGLDQGLPVGTPLRAAAPGVVVDAVRGYGGGWGNHVVVDYGSDIQVRTAHMDRVDVSIGQTVDTNTVLGASGNTGASQGPHLHEEVRQGFRRGSARGKPLDPVPFHQAQHRTRDWFDMATKDELKDALAEVILERQDVRKAIANEVLDIVGGAAKARAKGSGVPAGEGDHTNTTTLGDIKADTGATIINVDPVGVAAGNPGQGPEFLRTVVEGLRQPAA